MGTSPERSYLRGLVAEELHPVDARGKEKTRTKRREDSLTSNAAITYATQFTDEFKGYGPYTLWMELALETGLLEEGSA